MSASTNKRKERTSVRFNETAEVVHLHNESAGDSEKVSLSIDGHQQQPTTTIAATPTVTRRKKRPRLERPNPDEIDDIDDYIPEEDDTDGATDTDAVIPGESQALEAKRKRRWKQHKHSNSNAHYNDGGGDDDNDDTENYDAFSTHIDKDTSLASEGIPIEAFNMDEEKTDGTGYFDGDTYIFRRGGGGGGGGGPGVDEEPDAWLDSINEGGDEEETIANGKTQNALLRTQRQKQSNNDEVSKMDALSKEALYVKLLPLLSDTETVSSALIRYGQVIKQERQKQDPQQHHNGINNGIAKQALNDLTAMASALFLKGDVSIYQQTRNDFLRMIAASSTTTASAAGSGTSSMNHNHIGTNIDDGTWAEDNSDVAAKSTRNQQDQGRVLWEYQGNGDGQIHGPYTSQQMMDWIHLGYFVGPTAVRIRTVQDRSTATTTKTATEALEEKEAKKTSTASIGDDLLSDLLEDDDQDDDENHNNTTEMIQNDGSKTVRGEWIMSDQVDFRQFI